MPGVYNQKVKKKKKKKKNKHLAETIIWMSTTITVFIQLLVEKFRILQITYIDLCHNIYIEKIFNLR